MGIVRGIEFAAVKPPTATLNADGTITLRTTLGVKSTVTIYATLVGAIGGQPPPPPPPVLPFPNSLSLTPSTFGITGQNGTVPLLATVKDQFGVIISPTPPLSWSSNDSRVTVSNVGLCTGIQTGASATITATVTGTNVFGSAMVSTPAAVPTTFTINAGFTTLAAAANAAGMKFGASSLNVNDDSHPNYNQVYQQIAGAGGFAPFEIWHGHWFGSGTAFTGLGLNGVSLNFLGVAAAEIARLQAQGTALCLTYPIDEGVNTGWSQGINTLVTNAAQAIQMAQTMVALNMSFFVPKALGTAYNNATTYSIGTLVSSAGANYLCIKAGTVGITPPNTTNWLPYPVSTITAWNSGTAYTPGAIVTNGGHTYTCYANNTNQAPPNYTFWFKTEQGVLDVVVPVNEPINNSGYPNSNKFQHFTGWSAATLCANAILWCFAADPTIRKYGLNAGGGEKTTEAGKRTAGLNLVTGVISQLSGIVPAASIDYASEGHVDCQGMQTTGGNFDTANFLNWIAAIQATGASFSISEFDVTDHMAGTIAQRQSFVGIAYTNFLAALERLAVNPDRFVCWQWRSPESWLQGVQFGRSDGLTMYPNPYLDENLNAGPALTAVTNYFTSGLGLQASIILNDALPHQIPASLTDQWGFAMSLANATWSSTNNAHIPVTAGGVVQANLGSQSATVTGSVPGTSLTQNITITTTAATLTALAIAPGSASIAAPTTEAATSVDQYGNTVSGGAGGVIALAAAGVGLSANVPALAAQASQVWARGRIRVDDLRNLALNGGCGLLAIDSDGAGANKKFEVYIQTGSTAFVQLVVAGYKTGSVRIQAAPTPFVALTAFPANGNYVEWFAAWDVAALKAYVQILDNNGNPINDGAHTCTATVTVAAGALNTDGGANGRVTVNKAFNVNGTAKAMTWDGSAVSGGATPPALLAALTWQAPTVGETNCNASWIMGDGVSGSLSTAVAQNGGQNLALSGATGSTGDAGAWSSTTAGSVNWASDNTAVATVSPALGTSTVVTPVSSGVANVTATLPSNTAITGVASIVVQAPPTPTTLVLAPSKVTLITGQTVTLVGTVKDQYGNVMTGIAVAFSSGNVAVATVGASTGLVTFVASGSTTVTATVPSVPSITPQNCAVTCQNAVGTLEPSGMSVILPGVVWTAVPVSGSTIGTSTYTMLSALNGTSLQGGDSNNLTAVPSPDTGLRISYPSSVVGGNSTVRFQFSLPGAGKTLYMRFRIRYSTNWTNNGGVGTKICEPGFVSSNNGGHENDFLGGRCDTPADPTGQFLVMQIQENNINYFQNIPNVGNLTWAQVNPNGQLASATRGTWHTVEALFLPQSSVTSTTATADGVCTLAVDGTVSATASNIAWVQPNDTQSWGTLLFDPTYGGAPSTVHPPATSPPIFWDLDQLYVSSK